MDYRSFPANFVADAPGLDFLNSLATPVDVPVDWIADGEGLLNWLEQSGWVPVEVTGRMRAQASSAELDEVAARARDLREWFRTFVQKRRGRALVRSDLRELDALNRALREDHQYGALVATDAGGFEYRLQRRWDTPDALLMPIVESLAKLVCEEDFTHIKHCEGSNCTMLFVDHTRGHARRWCSMAICGNRAKVAAHRKRMKDAQSKAR